nr:DNA topoisomerase 2 [Tanacetum cinerariifolium]
MLDELEKNGLEKVEEGYDYLLSMSFMSYTKEKIKELKQERAGKEKELDALNQANSRSLWKADLVALDEQLNLDKLQRRKHQQNELQPALYHKGRTRRDLSGERF